MSEMWRVMDTGLRSAAQNIALDRALLEARQAEEIPSTLRFSRCTPSVLLAYHQSAAQEIDLDYCAAHKIALQRRITGGDAVYCDGGQLGWALYLHRRDIGAGDLQAMAKRLCHAAAAAVRALGLDARYRARHDIEVDGRRLGSAGGTFDGNALLYQGQLLVDLAAGDTLRALRTPAAIKSDQTPVAAQPDPAFAAARERVTDLKSALGASPDVALIKSNLIAAFESEFGVEFHDGDLSLTEHARYRGALAEIDAPDWINLMRQPRSGVPVCAAVHKTAGGMLSASLVHDRAAHRIKQIWFAYDKAVKPQRLMMDLEAALRDTAVARLEQNVRGFFAGRAVEMSAVTPGDFVAVVRRALKLPLVAQNP